VSRKGPECSPQALAAQSPEDAAATATRLFANELGGVYTALAADAPRVNAYERAIRRVVAGRRVLDIGTGPEALLAVLCARGGAARVFAVEAVPGVAARARETVAQQGLTATIEVLEGYSTVLDLPAVDLVVHEIVGDLATEEGLAACLADLQRRPAVVNAAPGWSLPCCVETWCAPVRLHVDEDPETPGVRRLPFVVPEQARLGELKLFEKVDANVPVELQQCRTMTWTIKEGATLTGLACLPRIQLDEEEVLDTWTSGPTNWRTVFVRLDPVPVETGDEVSVVVNCDLTRFPVVHTFTVSRLRGQKSRSVGTVVVSLSEC